MNRLSTGALALLMAAGFGASSVIAAPAHDVQGNKDNSARLASSKMIAQATEAAPAMAPAMPPADFGTPPSGEVPILFNDHHVYSKPSTLRAGRVLTALVRGNNVLVPLRSLFEQTGGTVSYDPSTKTVDVSKPGSDVKVTVGRPEVVINGESRPLDVPPEMYRGTVVVPLRVLAEGMGAYVQWVPDRKVVVVRYVTATPPPPPPVVEPSAAPIPTVAPTMEPTPEPVQKKTSYERYIIGDYLFKPRVYNEFNNGSTTGNGGSNFSYGIKGAVEFPLFNLPWVLVGDYRNTRNPANNATTGVSVPGGTLTYANTFTVRTYDFDGHFGLKIADPRIYIGVGYLYRGSNEPYPKVQGVGFGIEKLPDLDQQLSIYGSAYYYPSAKSRGEFIGPNGQGYTIGYRVLKYSIGGTFSPAKGPVFLDFGWQGERGNVKQGAINSYTQNGPFVGLGVHF